MLTAKYKMFMLVLSVVSLLGIATSAFADTVEYGTPPYSDNGFPFNFNADVGTRYQQVYNSSFFTVPVFIHKISFFNSGTVTPTFRTATYTIHLSTTSKAVNGLNTTDFSDNVGPDDAFFDSQFLTGSVPSKLTFDGINFLYDPSIANLLVDIMITDIGSNGSGGMDAENGTFGTDSSRAHNFGAAFSSYGLRTEFETVPVPEPSTYVTLGLLLLGSAYAVARRRAKASH